MKKNHLTKLFGLTFTAVLLTASLAACGSAGTTAPAPSADSPDTVSDAAGTLLLSVNPEIEMEYDKDGNVVVSFDEYEIGPGSMGIQDFVVGKSLV